MKLTSHNGRVDSAGLHNDRNYDVDLSPHINQDKTKENKYWTYTGTKETNLYELELQFYKENFSEYLNERNEEHIKDRHRNRTRTMEQFYKGKLTRPEDKILQIGDRNSHIEPEKLWECALEYQRKFNEIFGKNCKILDMSLHVDEETPHIHIRRVWMYEDEKGRQRVGQTKALQELGILRSDTQKEEGRYNNAKITFTKQDRELFRNICLEKGITLEADTQKQRKHLSVPEYKEVADEIRELEQKKLLLQKSMEYFQEEETGMIKACEALEHFLTNPMFYNLHDQEVAAARKKAIDERIIQITKMFQEEAAKVEAAEGSFRKVMEESYLKSKASKMQTELNKVTKEVSTLEDFIKEKGLQKEYKEYKVERSINQSPHRQTIF